MYRKHNKKVKSGQIILLIIMLIVTVLVAIPVLFVFISAFTDESVIAEERFRLFPSKLSLDGFHTVLRYGKRIFISYGITIFVTVTGTVLGLLIMSMYAYVLTVKIFPLRNIPSSALAAMQGRIPQYSATMATVVVAIAPVLIAYPFFHKYLIKGLTMSSVKD